MKNISPALPWSVTVKHLNHFSQRMQASGYDERYRFQIIKSGVAGYEKEESGGRPFNTPRSWEEDLRQKKKHIQKKSWFSKGGFHVPRKSFLEILFQIRLQNFLREYRCSIQGGSLPLIGPPLPLTYSWKWATLSSLASCSCLTTTCLLVAASLAPLSRLGVGDVHFS